MLDAPVLPASWYTCLILAAAGTLFTLRCNRSLESRSVNARPVGVN